MAASKEDILNTLGTWQQRGLSHWVFGKVIRGIIRQPLAEVYFSKNTWNWIVKSPTVYDTSTLEKAIYLAEEKLYQEEAVRIFCSS